MACVRKRGDTYRVDWRDKKGNRYRKTFELRKDAEDFVATVKVDMKAGTYVAPKDIPTFRGAAEQWFDNKRGLKLRPSTLQGYRVNLDCHLLKANFVDVLLGKITVADLVAFRNALAEKRVRGNKVLSAKTINYILRDLDGVFAFAVKNRLASWNPGKSVDRLKIGSEEQAGEDEAPTREDVAVTEEEVLSPADCRKLIENAPEGHDRAFLMTAVMTGARHDELLALMWKDVDLERGTLHFRRSLSWAKLPGEPTQPRFFKTKTGSKGNRKLPCAPELMLTLKKWRLRCPKGELGLVFPGQTGAPQHRGRILDMVLRPALGRAELPLRFHVHTLRHSFCSALLAQGTPPTEVQRYSGHARLSTLLDVYSHFIPSEQTGALERLASRVLG